MVSLQEYKNVIDIGIPETHYTFATRGDMGTGKSKFDSLLANQISQREDLPVYLYIHPSKLETTLPFYEKNCPSFQLRKTLLYSHFKEMRRSIVVIEDEPLYSRTEYRYQVLKSLVTALARQNRIFTVLSSQDMQRLPTRLKAELDVRDHHHLYRMIEGRNSSPWMDWTENSTPDISKAIEAVYQGVAGRELGNLGRPVRIGSSRQTCFEFFDKGLTAREVVTKLESEPSSVEYNRVYTYWAKWKRKQDAQPNIDTLR